MPLSRARTSLGIQLLNLGQTSEAGVSNAGMPDQQSHVHRTHNINHLHYRHVIFVYFI